MKMFCEICQIEFSTKQTFKIHYLRRHEKTIFICKICHVISFSTNEKIWHRINDHKFIFKCYKCERTFKEKKALNRHIRINHNNLRIDNAKSSKSSATLSASVKKSKRGNLILRLKGTVFYI